jgi:hypothetical protein
MKNIFLSVLLLYTIAANAQYNSQKIKDILTGGSQKSWTVTGINIERPERVFIFKTDLSGIIENNKGGKQNIKWSLRTNDNIRYFITIGKDNYELIVSYDKKGEQYIKLTHGGDNVKSSGYYEIKLTPLK